MTSIKGLMHYKGHTIKEDEDGKGNIKFVKTARFRGDIQGDISVQISLTVEGETQEVGAFLEVLNVTNIKEEFPIVFHKNLQTTLDSFVDSQNPVQTFEQQ